MDLRQTKRIHVKCPKCDYDFGINTRKIVEDKQNATMEASNLKKRLSELKQKFGRNYQNAPEYKRVRIKYDDCIARLSAINVAYRNICEITELEKYKVFYGLIKRELGEEKAIKLIQEAEDDLLYNDVNEFSKQKYNTFNGA